MRKTKVSTINEKDPSTNIGLYRSLARVSGVDNLDGGGMVNMTVLPIVKTIKINKRLSVDYEIITVQHGLGKRLDFFGRYRKSTDTNWTTLQEFRGNNAETTTIITADIRDNDMDILVNFGNSERPEVYFEFFFINFGY